MGLGMGTYALFWEWSEAVEHPIDLPGMLDRTAELGCDVFQICDYPLIETMDARQLNDIAAQASGLGLALELGTRGTRSEHLNRYLDIAEALGARMLRSMVRVGAGEPTLDESLASVRGLLGRLHEDGVSIAFETYEQLPSARLVQFVTDDAEMKAVRPLERGISMVAEHWLTWQGDPQSTIALERRWTRQTLDYVRNHIETEENNHE